MIVAKFGGTSLQNAARIGRAVQIVHEQSRGEAGVAVVVSAIGDTTRALLSAAGVAQRDRAGALALLGTIRTTHLTVADELSLDPAAHRALRDEIEGFVASLEKLVDGVALLGHCTARTEDAFLSHGERFSTALMTAAARAAGIDAVTVDAAQWVRTDAHHRAARPVRADVDRLARANFGPLLDERRVPITQGFIGATADGVPTTMGFEASDFTAALLGAAMDATEVQIWTDVPGMLTTGEADVENVATVRRLSFDEAEEMARFGARVLHPDTVAPARERRVPLRVRATQAPERDGTTILTGDRAATGVKSIAVARGMALIRLEAPHGTDVGGAARTLWRRMSKADVAPLLVSLAGRRAVFVAPASDRLERILHRLDSPVLSRRDPCAVVSLVGTDVGATRDILGAAVRAIPDVATHLIGAGASPHSTSVVVDEDAVPAVVASLHAVCIELGAGDIFEIAATGAPS